MTVLVSIQPPVKLVCISKHIMFREGIDTYICENWFWFITFSEAEFFSSGYNVVCRKRVLLISIQYFPYYSFKCKVLNIHSGFWPPNYEVQKMVEGERKLGIFLIVCMCTPQ